MRAKVKGKKNIASGLINHTFEGVEILHHYSILNGMLWCIYIYYYY